jgi:hypothetical protein
MYAEVEVILHIQNLYNIRKVLYEFVHTKLISYIEHKESTLRICTHKIDITPYCLHTYIHACMHVYMHIITPYCLYAYIHTCISICFSECALEYMCVSNNIYIHIYVYDWDNFPVSTLYIHTYIHACIHCETYIHTYIHCDIHTQMHTCIHLFYKPFIRLTANTYIHIYMHTCILMLLQALHKCHSQYIHTHVHTYMHTFVTSPS